MSNNVVLKAENLGIAFGGLKAVDNFNIELGESELVGLIGPNGAGKTTIFNLLTGVYKPTYGKLTLNNKKMNGKKTYQFVNEGIARTFQNIRLFKKMTVLDNVKVAFNKNMKYSIPHAIFRLGSYWNEEEEIDKKARALATDMKVLLLDEPAAGMNPTETAELLECINLIRKKFNISILLIEHDMSLVMNVCERIIVIDYGVTIAKGLPNEIANNPKVIAAYLGE